MGITSIRYRMEKEMKKYCIHLDDELINEVERIQNRRRIRTRAETIRILLWEAIKRD